MRSTLVYIVLFFSFFNAYTQNPWIQPIVQSVKADTIFATIADLQTMDRVTASNSSVPQAYLKQKLEDYGMDTVFYHYYKPNTPPNVVGIRYGTQNPSEFWLLGGHYDAVLAGAGADDNASGTAGVLEMGRVLQDYEIRKSLILVLFSGEETGLWGSKAFADSAVSVINMAGMINLDMIAYSHNLEDSSVSACWKYFASDLMQDFLTGISLYVPELKVDQDSTSSVLYASDHASFWTHLIPALFLIENSDRWGGSFNPWYHQLADTIGKGANSPWLAEKITRAAIAALLINIEPFSTISVPEPWESQNFSFYPNPATTNITLQLPLLSASTEPVSIILYDRQGRMVISENDLRHGAQLDISFLPKGVYAVRLISGQQTATGKLVKL